MGCSSDPEAPPSTCSETRCDADEVRCFGNAVWTCAPGGLAWGKVGCGNLDTCQDGECIDRAVCLVAGKRECTDEALGYTTCAADGLSEITTDCAAGEACQEGACLAEGCVTGDVRCGYRTVLTCEAGGSWSGAECSGGEICTEDDDGARCEDWTCQPLTSTCDGGTALACDLEGRSETRTDCGDDQICESGHCLTATCAEIDAGLSGAAAGGCTDLCEMLFAPDATDDDLACAGQSLTDEGLDVFSSCNEPTDTATCMDCMGAASVSAPVCGRVLSACLAIPDDIPDDPDAGLTDVTGGSGEDAGPEDVAAHPGLEPISRVDFKLNGIPNTFDLAAMADYQETDSRFVISASDGTRKLEINLTSVPGFSVGAWSDSDGSNASVAVCYHDGTANETPPDGAGCSVGFSHASILYALQVATNNGNGSRVTGTFAASMVDAANGQLEFTEGTFDVLHQ